MKIYSWLIFLICFLGFGKNLEARKYKAPKWKNENFVSVPEGFRASIIKAGKGAKIKSGDNVRFFYTRYDRSTRLALTDTVLDRKRGLMIKLETESNYLEKAMKMLAKGGQGYFILPTGSMTADGKPDSALFYLRIKDIIPGTTTAVISGQEAPKDSIGFVLPDPEAKNFGDTLFTTMKLVEVTKIVPCGMMRMLNVFKFSMTWFDQGMHQKDIYLYVECPENYGKDYFTAGSTYVVTAIPLLENHKKNKQVFNFYANANDKIESYYCLRLTKK